MFQLSIFCHINLVYLSYVMFLERTTTVLFSVVEQTPNPAWPTSMFFHSPLSERLKDLSVKNWTHLAGSGPVPWRQAPSLFNSSIPSSELHTRVPYEVDVSTGINKLNASERIFVSSMEKKKVEDFSERLMKVNLTMGTQESLENGKPGMDSFMAFQLV